MTDRYGLPYKGSKNKIAKWVIDCLPPNDNFYDLFCGGCSVTHAALESGRYKGKFIANDVIGELPQTFMKAAHGELNIDYKFVTRDEFFKRKDNDIVVRLCYSFGTKGDTYLYGRDREDFKKAAHNAIVFQEFDELAKFGYDLSGVCTQSTINDRYVAAKKFFRGLKTTNATLLIENLQRLQRFIELQSLERLYHDVNISPNSTVYCDIPYIGTSGYGNEFDHKDFYQWCLTREFPVFVSEYQMPEEFVPIAVKGKRVTLSKDVNNTLKGEKIFVQKRYAEKYKRDLFI